MPQLAIATWRVVVGRGVSPHGLTITPPPTITRHVAMASCGIFCAKMCGTRGPGTIKETIIVEGIGPMNHTKQIFDDGVEQENYECNYSVVGGDPNNDTVRNVSYNSKIVTTPYGGYSSSTSSYSSSISSYSSHSTSTGKHQVNAKGTEGFKAIKNHPHPPAYN